MLATLLAFEPRFITFDLAFSASKTTFDAWTVINLNIVSAGAIH